MTEQGKGLGFGVGLVLGATVGAILGLLFAPQPGEQTREMLKSKGRERWHETYLQGKETATRMGADLREKLEKARGKKEVE